MMPAGQGHFYGVRPLMGMNIPIETGVLRLSFLHYTTKDEIRQLIKMFKLWGYVPVPRYEISKSFEQHRA